MEIKQLEYVIMAADMGSFNKASEFLYTTQSNVSKVIRSLEKELGYDIFRRQGSGVLLTESGQKLYEQSRQVLMMLKQIEESSNLTHKTCFHIASVVSNFLSKCFANFIRQHSSAELCLKMWESNLGKVLDLTESGEVEMGLLYLEKKQLPSFQVLLQKKGLFFTEILPARVEICLGPKHPWYDRKSVAEEELKEMEYVCLMEDNVSKVYHLHSLEKTFHLEKNMSDAIEVASSSALMNILAVTDRAHLCYGSVMDAVRTNENSIRAIPVDCEKREIFLGYIHKISKPLSSLSKDFLAAISEEDKRGCQ